MLGYVKGRILITCVFWVPAMLLCNPRSQSLPGLPGAQNQGTIPTLKGFGLILWGLSSPYRSFNLPGCEVVRSQWLVQHLSVADSQGLNSQAAPEAVPLVNPWLSIMVIFTVGLSNQLSSLLLALLPGGWKLPVDQGEPTEDEEHPSPPQDLLALSIQHVA